MQSNPTLDLVFGVGRSVPTIDHDAYELSGTPASFWAEALSWAQEAHTATGVLVSVILAQWAIESGYGGPDWLPPRNNPGNVGNFTAGGQMDYPTLAAGVQGYITCMRQGYYAAVRVSVGYVAQSLALGQSPWAGAHYELPGGYPGSELIWVIQNYNLTQYDGATPTPPPKPPVVIPFRKPITGKYGKLDAPAVALCPTPNGDGYTIVAADGGTFNYNTPMKGSLAGSKLNAPIIDAVLSPSGNGLTLVGTDGGVYCLGDAVFCGSMGGVHLNAPIVSIVATLSGKGYWLVGADGGVFNYGDAGFYGSAGSIKLAQPVVGIASTTDGKGYYLVAADGGIFSYGDAYFYGSEGGTKLNAPVVDMAPCHNGVGGYWLLGTDGGIFTFGSAQFHGSTGGQKLNAPIVAMAASSDGNGYWLLGADGGIFNYGDAGFFGSPG